MSIDVRIKAEDTRLVILFPTPTRECIISYQQALEFARELKDVAEHIPNPPLVVSPGEVDKEQAQVELGNFRDKGVVILLSQHTDRLYFSKESALMVSKAVKIVATQVKDAIENKVRFLYDKQGHLRVIHDDKTNTNKYIG